MAFDGNIRTGDWVPEIELTLDNAIYASGDLMANPVELKDATKENGTSIIQSVVVTDYDDQGGALHLLVFKADPGVLGTLNDAMLIDDGQAELCCGHVVVSATDYTDLGSQQTATVKGIGLEVHPTNGTSLWVAAKSMGAKTYPKARLSAKVGMLRG